jgi:hypothetical protein
MVQKMIDDWVTILPLDEMAEVAIKAYDLEGMTIRWENHDVGKFFLGLGLYVSYPIPRNLSHFCYKFHTPCGINVNIVKELKSKGLAWVCWVYQQDAQHKRHIYLADIDQIEQSPKKVLDESEDEQYFVDWRQLADIR